ncbi:MAG TPA: ABC transporter ATP-binding protein, partial [Thermomicrobiales bacterium]|nr:ABC transporter ATP-binding protein [Thermomicrobiales bacterium]
VLLLDEPLSHLDAKLRAAMRAELKSLGELQHTTSLYVTHDYLEALALGDRIAVLRQGKLVQVGSPAELWRHPADIFVAEAFGQPRINLVGGATVADRGGVAFRSDDGEITIPLGPAAAPPGQQVVLGLRPRDLVVGEQPGLLPIAGRVYVVEPLDRQYEVTVQVGAHRIAAVTPNEGIVPDSLLTLSARPDRLHLFDAATGRLPLEPVPASPNGSATTEAEASHA